MLFPGLSGFTLERLRRELRLVRELRHPGILRIHDIGSCDGLLYLVSEFLHGESLRDRLARVGQLDLQQTRRILGGLFEALAAAHEAGIVHRDVKPANIYLARGEDGSERVVLLDFGLAREAGAAGLTTVGRFLGTPEYSAPEQVRGEHLIGPPADLYAAGATAWQMIAGKPPFTGISEISVMTAHVSASLPSPRRELSRVPPSLRSLVADLLEKRPGRRPSAREARRRLDRSGVWDNVGGRLCLALKLGRKRGSRLILIAVFLASCLALVSWGLSPQTLRIQGGDLRITTRAGIDIIRSAPGRPICTAVLGGRGLGLFRPIWLATAAPGPLRIPPDESDCGLWSAPSLMLPFTERLSGTNRIDYWDTSYPHVEGGALTPNGLVSFDRHRRAGEPIVALKATHSPSYPSRVTIVSDTGGITARYLHSGHVQQLRPFRHPETDELYLAGSAMNNLAGLRHAIFGIPASVQSEGQSPPFAAPVTNYEPAGGWYTFLPYRSYLRPTEIRVEGDLLSVQIAGYPTLRLDLRDGVPEQASQREDLDREQWKRFRDRLQEVLFEAAGAAQIGDHAAAAAALSAFGRQEQAPREMRSIAWYRAAIESCRQAASDGASLHEQAYAYLREALALEPLPARYRMLHLELLIRTGRQDEASTILRRWGSQPQELMYSYEYLLLNTLAGSPIRPERFISVWADASRLDSWKMLVQMVISYQQQDWQALERSFELAAAKRRTPWDLHSFWLAQSLLDRPDADPVRALENLSDGALARDTGLVLPVETARLLATVMRDGRAPVALFENAQAELASFESEAAADLHAWYMLPIARRNLERAARYQGPDSPSGV